MRQSDYYNLGSLPIREVSKDTILERLLAQNLEPSETRSNAYASIFAIGIFVGFCFGILTIISMRM